MADADKGQDRIPPDPNQDVQVAALLLRVQQDLTSWAKSRIWFVTILASVTGVLGLYTIFQQTLRLVLESPVQVQIKRMEDQADKVDIKLAEQLARYEASYQKAADELSKLQTARELTEEATRLANAAALSAKVELENTKTDISSLQSNLKEMSAEVEKGVEKIKTLGEDNTRITASSMELYTSTFDIDSNITLNEIIANAKSQYIEKMIETIGIFVASHTVNSESDARASVVRFTAGLEKLKDEFRAREEKFKSNSQIKIVLYLKQGAGLFEQVDRAGLELKKIGYRADIWNANGSTVEEAAVDIAKDFPEISNLLYQYRTAVVVDPKQVEHGKEIKSILERYPLFEDIPLLEAKTGVVERHLQRARQKNYTEDKIILVFLFSEQSITAP